MLNNSKINKKIAYVFSWLCLLYLFTNTALTQENTKENQTLSSGVMNIGDKIIVDPETHVYLFASNDPKFYILQIERTRQNYFLCRLTDKNSNELCKTIFATKKVIIKDYLFEIHQNGQVFYKQILLF